MITHVAIRNIKSKKTYYLPKPNRHNHVISLIVKNTDYKRVTTAEWTQGFVTKGGLFLDRKFAAEHAFSFGQIKEKKDLLFSEDLW